MIGGIISSLLQLFLHLLGVKKNVNLRVTASVGLATAAVALARYLYKDLTEVSDGPGLRSINQDMARKDASIAAVTVRFEGICKVMHVDDLEDCGPGFLLRTRDDEYIYLATQMFEDMCASHGAIDLDEGGDTLDHLSEICEVDVLTEAQEIIAIRLEGDSIPVCGSVSVTQLPVDFERGFAILSKEELHSRWGRFPCSGDDGRVEAK